MAFRVGQMVVVKEGTNCASALIGPIGTILSIVDIVDMKRREGAAIDHNVCVVINGLCRWFREAELELAEELTSLQQEAMAYCARELNNA